MISLKKTFHLKISDYQLNLKNYKNKFVFLYFLALLSFIISFTFLKTILYEFHNMVTEFTLSNKNYKFNINEKT